MGLIVLGAALFVTGSVGKVYANAEGSNWSGLLYCVPIALGGACLLAGLGINPHPVFIVIGYFLYFSALSAISNWLKTRNSAQSPS